MHCWRKCEECYKKASFFSYLNSKTDETTYDNVKWSLFYQGLIVGETVDKNEIEITDKIMLSRDKKWAGVYYEVKPIQAFTISDIGLFWLKKLDIKFSRVFIRYIDTH